MVEGEWALVAAENLLPFQWVDKLKLHQLRSLEN
jgi:hypothetical protein